MPTPPDQRYLTIAFHLTGGGMDLDFALNVRPEDLSVPESSRAEVQQTLGGAWGDVWGKGLPLITLNGNTGWRGAFLMSGVDAFFALKTVIFDEWHSRRLKLVQQGQDPNQVKLIYADALNQRTDYVIPMSFVLRRSKGRPLLYNYSIQLKVVGDASASQSLLDEITGALNNPLRFLAGIAGLGDAVIEAQYIASTVVNTVGAVCSGVASFINIGVGVLQTIGGIASTLNGDFDQAGSAILNVGQTYSMAAHNAFSALAADPSLPPQQALPVMQMASLWGGSACLIRNSFNAYPTYPTYDALVGASYCSSTGGGDPPSAYGPADNPWEDITPTTAPPIIVTPAAQAAMGSLAAADPILLIGQGPSIGTSLTVIAGGVTLL
jgi:hypothetical protein